MILVVPGTIYVQWSEQNVDLNKPIARGATLWERLHENISVRVHLERMSTDGSVMKQWASVLLIVSAFILMINLAHLKQAL